MEQFILRSVDSECMGRVIEPRKHNSRGSRHCREGGRQHRSAVVAEREDSAGVEEQGTFMMGSSRNLGGPVVSAAESGLGESGKQSPALGCRALRLWERSLRRSGGTTERRQRSEGGRTAGSRSAP
jgi:hypothetical protein